MKIINKLSIFCCITNIIMIAFLIVTYGPSDKFKNWWITTAMDSGNHKWLAKVLYSENTIKNVLLTNSVIEVNESTDESAIDFNNQQVTEYSSIYEKQILDRNPEDLYKLIRIKENGYSGYLVAIYDSSRIKLATSPSISYGGSQMLDLASKEEAIVAINASGFSRRNGGLVPTGTVIEDGKIKSVGSRNRHGGGLIGFTYNNVLMLTTDSAENAIKKGMKDAMTFGPFLIVNGIPSEIMGNGGYGTANRTAIGQRKDGIVLFLVIDGRGADGSNGISMNDMITLFQKYGAYNAANLDGGGSSTLVIENELINNPRGYGYIGERYLPNAWILK